MATKIPKSTRLQWETTIIELNSMKARGYCFEFSQSKWFLRNSIRKHRAAHFVMNTYTRCTYDLTAEYAKNFRKIYYQLPIIFYGVSMTKYLATIISPIFHFTSVRQKSISHGFCGFYSFTLWYFTSGEIKHATSLWESIRHLSPGISHESIKCVPVMYYLVRVAFSLL